MENDDESCPKAKGGGGGEEEEIIEQNVLRFLDSMDGYLTLMDSLSSTLRQGWLELASARHSMGSSRISSVLLDYKVQSAATTLQVSESTDKSLSESHPHFTLSKWASMREGKSYSGEVGPSGLQKKFDGSQLRHRGPSTSTGGQDASSAVSDSPTAINIQERSKSLAVFGTLVSPKLRSAQVSFETALDRIVEIANMRSVMVCTFSQLQQEMKNSS